MVGCAVGMWGFDLYTDKCILAVMHFFPEELHSTIDPNHATNGTTKKKAKKLQIDKGNRMSRLDELDDEGEGRGADDEDDADKDPEDEDNAEEEQDEDFEDEEDDEDDYNAEQYFEDGEADEDYAGDDTGGGGYNEDF